MVGVGNISSQYLATLSRLEDMQLTTVADLDLGRTREVARANGVTGASVEDLLTDDEVDLVLNLTIPRAHAEIALAAIAEGKSVYTEKPLAATVAEARAMVTAAESAGVVVGGAPDTVLGTGVQTARAVLDAGGVGTPISATATMIVPGHEAWHPNPDFYYQPGGGPLLDMGPYYITALVTLLGPVTSVIGASSALRGERVIGSGPRKGEQLAVSTPSHVTGVLVHATGVLSTLMMSFDGTATHAKPLEVHGSEGSMTVPDPNRFSGPVLLDRGDGWQEQPVSAGYRGAARGYGVADLYWAGAFHSDPLAGRCQGGLALHVLEVMESLLAAGESGNAVDITSTTKRPAAVPLGQR